MRVQNIWNKGLARVQGAGRRGVLCREGMCLPLHGVRTLLMGRKGCLPYAGIHLAVVMTLLITGVNASPLSIRASKAQGSNHPHILVNINNGDIYLSSEAPVIDVQVVDDDNSLTNLTIYLNNERITSGYKVTKSGLYKLRVVATDVDGNSNQLFRFFMVEDEPIYIGKSLIYNTVYLPDGTIELIAQVDMDSLLPHPNLRWADKPQICYVVPVLALLLDRNGNILASMKPFTASTWVPDGVVAACCPEDLEIGSKSSFAHFREQISSMHDVDTVRIVGFGELSNGDGFFWYADSPIATSRYLDSAIYSRRCRGGGGGGQNRCTLPQLKLKMFPPEFCPSNNCQREDNDPYDCDICWVDPPFLYCSGHYAWCHGSQIGGLAEARDDSYGCYAQTEGNADDWIRVQFVAYKVPPLSDPCPCDDIKMTVDAHSVIEIGVSKFGSDTVALGAGAFIIISTGACSLNHTAAAALAVGNLSQRTITLNIGRGSGGSSGSVSIGIDLPSGDSAHRRYTSQARCEGSGNAVTVVVSSGAYLKARANGGLVRIPAISMAEINGDAGVIVCAEMKCTDSNGRPVILKVCRPVP